MEFRVYENTDVTSTGMVYGEGIIVAERDAGLKTRRLNCFYPKAP